MVERLDLGILLGLAYQAFTDQLRGALAAQGFTDLGGAYGYVFRVLADEELSQRALAARLGITDQGMAKILGEMVERGYVERRADPDDARVKRLRLARRGRQALAAARRFHAAFEARLVAGEGAAAVRGLRRLLEVVGQSGGADDLAQARLRAT
jgi:DNA-binding MarR family transcriptional regulator